MAEPLRDQVVLELRRPAVLLVLAVVALMGAVYIGTTVWHKVEVGRTIDRHVACASVNDTECLTQIRDGDLSGPQNQWRTRNDEWRLRSGAFDDVFRTGPSDSDLLSQAKIESLYAYDDDVVSVVTDQGEVRPLDVGTRGAVQRGGWAVALLGLALGSAVNMLSQRRAGVGWVAPSDAEAVRGNPVAMALTFGGIFTAGPMFVLALSWQTGVVIGLLAGVVPQLFRRGRHRR